MSRNERTGEGGAVTSVEQLIEKAIDVAEDFRQASAAVKTAAREMVDVAKQNAAEYSRHGFEAAQSCERKVEDRIRQRPIQWVLGAAGAGALFGVLFCATRRSG